MQSLTSAYNQRCCVWSDASGLHRLRSFATASKWRCCIFPEDSLCFLQLWWIFALFITILSIFLAFAGLRPWFWSLESHLREPVVVLGLLVKFSNHKLHKLTTRERQGGAKTFDNGAEGTFISDIFKDFDKYIPNSRQIHQQVSSMFYTNAFWDLKKHVNDRRRVFVFVFPVEFILLEL